MGYISVDDLVQNMTPEQRILVAQFYAKFDIGSGVAHKKILNIELLFYQGVIAASEFTVYVANKLYLSLDLEFCGLFDVAYLGGGEIKLMNENNVESFRAINYLFLLDVATKYVTLNNISIPNMYFSRIDPGEILLEIKFIGYRITLT